MQVHKAQETIGPFHGHAPWSWIAIGVAMALIVAALGIGLATQLGETTPELTVPVANSQFEPITQDLTKDQVLRGRGSVDVVGATKFAATDVREGGAYVDNDAVATPRHGLCAAKWGC
jgi:hypothetical protein